MAASRRCWTRAASGVSPGEASAVDTGRSTFCGSWAQPAASRRGSSKGLEVLLEGTVFKKGWSWETA